jgi:hypothetical protein
MMEWQSVLKPGTLQYAEGFYPKAEYEFMREGYKPWVARASDFHPQFNVWGLMYRQITASRVDDRGMGFCVTLLAQ